MSDWRGHLKLGFVYQIITLVVLIGVHIYLKKLPSFLDFILLPFIFILSPLLPDLDHQSSKITLFFYLVGVACLWPAYFFNQYMIYVIIFLSLVVIISQFVPHRGITHRWWAILLFYTLLAFITKQYSICILAFFGSISHLVADKTC